MKKVIIVIIAIITLATLLVCISDDEVNGQYDSSWPSGGTNVYFTYNSIEYRIFDSDEVTVVNYDGQSSFLSIPSYVTYNGVNYEVSKIYSVGPSTYGVENIALKTLVIPSTVYLVYSHAFSNLVALESFEVDSESPYLSTEDGILYDEDQCTLISYPIGRDGTEYSVKSGVVTIARGAFSNSELTSIYMSSTVRTIEAVAFNGCSNLEYVSLNNVESIGHNAFGASTIESLYIPRSVSEIGDAFFNALSLKEITVESGNQYFSSDYQGILYNKDGTELICCPPGIEDTVTITENITTIGDSAFDSCSKITSIALPEGLNRIESMAFFNCTNLLSINIPSSVTYLSDDAFDMNSGTPIIFYDEDRTPLPTSASLAGYSYASDTRGILIRNWEPATEYSVTYNVNGGNTSGPSTTYITEGTSFTLEDYEGTRTGYTFEGWSYSGNVYAPGSTLVMGSSNITLTAVWEPIVPTSITLNREEATINTSDSITLVATIDPSDALNTRVTWSSSNTNVATVSSTGVVRGVNEGTAVITATTVEGGLTASCIISVNLETIEVQSISLNYSSYELNEGEQMTLMAIIRPSDATNQNITWMSSNTNVATVSSNGVVTAVGSGTVRITATTEDGNHTATCNLTVVADETVSGEPDDNNNNTMLILTIIIIIVILIAIALVMSRKSRSSTIREIDNLRIRPPRRI